MYIYAFIYPQISVESTGISLWIRKDSFSRVDSYFFIHKQLWTTFPAPLLTISELSTGSTASITTVTKKNLNIYI